MQSPRFTVLRIAGDKDLTDNEVFLILKSQMRRNLNGGTLQISVKAKEEQVDKAMQALMGGVAKRDIHRFQSARQVGR